MIINPAHPTQAATSHLLNTAVWAVSLALQIALVWRLLRTRSAREVPMFLVLIGFYCLRSALLYLIFGLIDADDYRGLYDALETIELALQFGFALWALAVLVRAGGGLYSRKGIMPVALTALTAAASWWIAAHAPSRGTLRVDRTQIFFGLLMGAFCVWSFALRGLRSSIRGVLEGFAIYGVVSIAATLGHTRAQLARDARGYMAWSWWLSGTYIAVVIFWLVRLWSSGPGNDAAGDSITAVAEAGSGALPL